MTISLTIIGLGRIGASIGLALGSHKDQLTITGHDKDTDVSKAALNMGAVDKIEGNLPASVEKADVVILALPLDQIQETLKAVAADLREDLVLLDTAPAKTATGNWVKDLLPPKRHYIGLLPALNPTVLEENSQGVSSARADLFKGGVIAVCAPRGTADGAIELASGLVSLLGSTPYFADPAEVDGMMACIHILPQLAAAALVETAMKQPGWGDIRKVSGAKFAIGTSLLKSIDAETLAEEVKQNPKDTMRLLDEMITTLEEMRDVIASGEPGKMIIEINKKRQQWQAERGKGNWLSVELKRPALPSSGDILRRQIGGLGKLFERRKKEN